MLLSISNDRDWLHARKFPNPSKLLIQILEPNRSSTNYRKRIVSRLVSYVFTSPQKIVESFSQSSQKDPRSNDRFETSFTRFHTAKSCRILGEPSPLTLHSTTPKILLSSNDHLEPSFTRFHTLEKIINLENLSTAFEFLPSESAAIFRANDPRRFVLEE